MGHKSNRRTFLKQVPVPIAIGVAATQVVAKEEVSVTDCLDYGSSFICNKATFNAVRFWIESRTILFDERNDSSQVFYQCGSCKSENTFAKENLFIKDNYDFLPVLGGTDWLIFRRHGRITDTYRRIQPDLWGEPVLKLRYPKKIQELQTFESVRDATAEGAPIVAQTEIQNKENGLRAVIEYPVKTMNISLDNSVYQVDTGPVAYPNLTKRYDHHLESLSLAFVAFNAAHFADFIVEQPTPVMQDGKELAQVYHYSEPFSLMAKNRLFSVSMT